MKRVLDDFTETNREKSDLLQLKTRDTYKRGLTRKMTQIEDDYT